MSAVSTPPFLCDSHKQHFIDGQWSPGSSGERISTFNPANGECLATLAKGTASDVDRAVAAARRAFEGPWSRVNSAQRQQIIIRFSELFEKHFEELALLDSIEMGAPLHTRMLPAKQAAVQNILYFSSQARSISGTTVPNSLPNDVTSMVMKCPVGVVGGVLAWNGPMFAQLNVIGPALATGCTVVLKPSEEASLSVLRTAQLLLEAGVPPGVVNVVTGLGSEAGAALASHPDVNRVSFTGSMQTGRAIINASSGNIKRLQLELGGKSPDIVFADADLDKAVPGVAMGVFSNTGQICFAGTRVLVQRSIVPEFVERMVAYSRTLKVGDPLAPDTRLGPIISGRQLERVLGYVEAGRAEGAELACGGSRLGGDLARGHFMEPTVFANVNNDMTIAREEIFGPVASIIAFHTQEEALAIANATDYGLGGGVWTRDISKAVRMMNRIQAGTVWVNCYGITDAAVGFGGYKHSGYGWKGGPSQIEGMLYEKAVYIDAG